VGGESVGDFCLDFFFVFLRGGVFRVEEVGVCDCGGGAKYTSSPIPRSTPSSCFSPLLPLPLSRLFALFFSLLELPLALLLPLAIELTLLPFFDFFFLACFDSFFFFVAEDSARGTCCSGGYVKGYDSSLSTRYCLLLTAGGSFGLVRTYPSGGVVCRL
jgi:hypothetical protein